MFYQIWISMKKGYNKHTELPSGWEIKSLDQLTTFVNGKAFSQDELLSEGKYKVLRVGNLNTQSNWYYSNLELDQDKYVEYGDLIYAWSASFGPKFWFNEKTIYHYHIWKVIPKEKTDKQFLFQLLDFDTQKILNQKQGGTMFHITKGDMETRKTITPPLPEQRAIANILSTWDTAIQTTQALISQKETEKKWLMQSLLTGKKRLKGFSGEWKEYHLSDIFNRVTRKNTEENTNVVTISAQRGFVKQTDFFNKTVASDTLNNYYLVEKGEFCYNKSYSNGYPWGATKRLLDFDKAVVTTLYICFGIRDIKSNSGDFFEHYFEANLLDRGLTRIAHEGGRAHGLLNVTPSDFFNLQITIPSLEEQSAIAQVLQTAGKEIELLKTKLEQQKLQKKGLMQVLLTGKVRVFKD